jgi:endonuclease/exonuclease/phosphatase family metal-dependent hydrolase
MNSILETTLSLEPDVICYQEVIEPFVVIIIQNQEILRRYSISSYDCSKRYSILTLVRRELDAKFFAVEFPTRMGRSLLTACFEIDDERYAVGNVHLESLNSHPTREKQLQILVGDFNFCSYRNFDKDQTPLENDSLTTYLAGFFDTWEYYQALSQTSVLNSVDASYESPPPKDAPRPDAGLTFDSAVNRNIKQFERMRYDRIMATNSLTLKWNLDSIRMIGTEPLSKEESNKLVWPSDHFGLFLTFQEKPS